MEILDKTPLAVDLAWPPPYNLRISKKAKHVHVRIYPHRGLEIVVPIRQQKRFVVADLLEEKKAWISKHLATVKIEPLAAITSLDLLAIQQYWQIEYKQTFSQQIRHSLRIGEKINVLTLYGNVNDITRTHLWLKAWLKKMATKHLIPWLRVLSSTHGLEFNKASVRGQQTLWGSCNADKNISLNYKLLFVPPKHAEHIMLHELCHTKHLNHSKRFWNLLIKLDPDALAHSKAIRHGDSFVPLCFN
jgi:predicted metal-dependent hydrolase